MPFTRLFSSSREAEQGCEPGAQRVGAECDEVVVEVVALGNDDAGGDARPRAAPGEAHRRLLALDIVVACDDEARDAGRSANAPRLPAESAAAAVMAGTAVTSDSTVSMPSPTRSEAPSAGRPNLTARP